MFRSNSRVTISSGRSTSNWTFSSFPASLALLSTSYIYFSTNFGSKGLILFYSIRLRFIFLMAISVSFLAISCYKDDRILTFSFPLLYSVKLLYVILWMLYYEGGICGGQTISIHRFSQLIRIISNARLSVNNFMD